MRVALINNLFVDQLGYFYISAVLKQAGHEVRMFITDRNLESDLRSYNPGVVGFTAVTGNHVWAGMTAQDLRQVLPKAKYVLGGPHPTYHPEVILHPGWDYICRGEGETSIVELVDALEQGRDTTRIPGIWAKDGNRIYENDFARQIEDLDSIPYPDRSLYDAFPFIRNHMHSLMLSSRGCPWQCSFCYAPTLASLTKGKGKFVRFRSVDNVVGEALELRRQFKLRTVEFVDDIFGMHRPWLREFSQKWREHVKLPFIGNLRADLINEEVVDLLADAGCLAVSFGIESGNDRVRNEILQKEVEAERILLAARELRRRKIKIITYNILGSPTESIEEAWDTVRINQKVRPDFCFVSLMQPYPKTKIWETAVREGVYDPSAASFDELEASYHDQSPLKIPHRREINNLQKLFNLAVWFPWLTPAVRFATRLPLDKFYYAVFLVLHTFGNWRRVKRVPTRFLIHLLLNFKELRRRHKSGLYKRHLWQRPMESKPTMREQFERGAL